MHDDIPTFGYLDTAKSAEFTPAEDAFDQTFIIDDDNESPPCSPDRQHNSDNRHDASESSNLGDDLADVDIHDGSGMDEDGVDHNVASYDPKMDSSSTLNFCYSYFRVLVGVTCALLFFIILVVMLTLAVKDVPEKDSSSAAATSASNGLYGDDSQGSSKDFKIPPQNISAVCTAEHIQTQAGFAECLQLCRSGSCCRFPSSVPDLSCIRGHEQDCQMYHHYCENPPAVASGNNNANSHTNLPAFAAPPASLSKLCSIDHVATKQGFQDCVQVCLPSTCCRMGDAGHPDLDCKQEHLDDCQIYYDHCRSIVGTKGYESSSATTTGSNSTNYVESVCSDHSLATLEGFEACLSMCNKQECCWKEGVTCPFDQQHTQCQAYAHCLALEASDFFALSIPETLDQKCSDASIQTTQGHKDCLTACSQAACCFGSTDGDCPQEQDSFCNQYQACAEVQNDILPPAPLTIQADCSSASLSTLDGVGRCEEACVRAPCCWANALFLDKNKGSCADTNPVCADYQPCQVLHGHHQQTSGITTTTTTDPPAAPTTELQLDCSANNLQTLVGLRQCNDDCMAAQCCWAADSGTSSSVASCAATHTDVCQQYNQCLQLQDPKSALNTKIDPAPATIAQDCTTQSLSTFKGMAECEASCMRAPCCWAEKNSVHYSCREKDPSICQFYDVCLQLHSLGSLAVSPAPSSLAQDCTSQSLQTYRGYTKCDDVCMMAPCCWGDAESPIGSCAETHPTICEGYDSCHLLNSPNSSLNSIAVEAAPSSIEVDCSLNSLKTATGLSKCEQTCMEAPCCWAVTDGVHYSCRASHVAACESYNPCMLLRHIDHSADTHTSGSSNTSTTATTTNSVTSGTTTSSPAVSGTTAPGSASSSVEVAPSYIATVCAAMINGDEIRGYLCELACRKAECCWDPAMTSCGTDPNCGGYTICGGISFGPALSSAVENPNPSKEWITNACQRNSLECVRVCTGTECCFNQTVTSTCSADCYNHTACSILHQSGDSTSAPLSSSGSGTSSTSTQSTTGKYSVEMISDACLNHDNSIVNLCAIVCEGSECCFSGADSSTCSVDCGTYAACASLHTSSVNSVTQACSTGDLADCVEACGTSSCCFTSDPTKSCAATNPGMICAEYTACEKLYKGEQ